MRRLLVAPLVLLLAGCTAPQPDPPVGPQPSPVTSPARTRELSRVRATCRRERWRCDSVRAPTTRRRPTGSRRRIGWSRTSPGSPPRSPRFPKTTRDVHRRRWTRVPADLPVRRRISAHRARRFAGLPHDRGRRHRPQRCGGEPPGLRLAARAAARRGVPPDTEIAFDCSYQPEYSYPTLSLVAASPDVTRAVLCARRQPEPDWSGPVPIPAEDLARLVTTCTRSRCPRWAGSARRTR